MVIPQRGGLPHSDTHGSKPARGSPWLFAACHVLHRLLVPRHPPNALLMLSPMHRNQPHHRATGHRHMTGLSSTQHTTHTPLTTAGRVTLAASLSADARVRHPRNVPTDRSFQAKPSHATACKPPNLSEPSCAPRDAPEPDSHEQRPSQWTTNNQDRTDLRPTHPNQASHHAHPTLPTRTHSAPDTTKEETQPHSGTGWAHPPTFGPSAPWRRTGSNRRPPACKAGALPAELRPRRDPHRETTQRLPPPHAPHPWAREDLNLRPHAYQACALTS